MDWVQSTVHMESPRECKDLINCNSIQRLTNLKDTKSLWDLFCAYPRSLPLYYRTSDLCFWLVLDLVLVFVGFGLFQICSPFSFSPHSKDHALQWVIAKHCPITLLLPTILPPPTCHCCCCCPSQMPAWAKKGHAHQQQLPRHHCHQLLATARATSPPSMTHNHHITAITDPKQLLMTCNHHLTTIDNLQPPQMPCYQSQLTLLCHHGCPSLVKGCGCWKTMGGSKKEQGREQGGWERERGGKGRGGWGHRGRGRQFMPLLPFFFHSRSHWAGVETTHQLIQAHLFPSNGRGEFFSHSIDDGVVWYPHAAPFWAYLSASMVGAAWSCPHFFSFQTEVA